jgi:hypothetical protein
MAPLTLGPDHLVPSVEDFLCRLLRHETMVWPAAAGAAFAADLLKHAGDHGVLPLIHDRIQSESAPGWPAGVVRSCREHAIGQAMVELRHRALLTEVLAALAAIGVRPVLFKGTALAYSIYPGSALRPRSDTDLIIAPEARAGATAALEAIGFVRPPDPSREFTFYQASFVRDEAGGAHALDVHWRINNAELLSRLFSYEDLLGNARRLPRLGPDAWAAGTVDALLLACLHRAVHQCQPYYIDGVARYDGNRLIWLYDIHLLAGSLAPQDWDELIGRATDKGLLAVCLEGLERTRECFHTAVPEPVLAALRQPTPEIVASYFRSGPVRQHWMDFRALPGAANKLRFLAELAFPPAAYMRARYPQERFAWLPWLYVRRFSGGALRRLHGRPHAP